MKRLAVVLSAGLFAIRLLLNAGALPGLEFSDIYAEIGITASDRVGTSGLTVFPTLIIPTGGKFESMGQAYTAVALDASFLDANPAGSSTLEYTELSLAHNNWIADSSIEAITYARRAGDFGIAAGGKFLHVPFTHYDTTSRQISGGRYSEGSVGLNASYNLLRSYSFPGVSVGATVKAAYRYVPEIVAPNQSAIGFAADFGVLSRFDLFKMYSARTPNFAAGAAARNFGPPVDGEPLPSQITTGIAYSPIRPITVATDLIVPVSLAEGVPPSRVGGAVGVCVRVTPFLTAQTGVLLRVGGSRFTLGATLDLTDLSVDVNYNLDLATRFSGLDRFSVQARLNFGDEGRGEIRRLVDKYYLEAWRASSLGQTDAAIEYSQRALDLDPSFSPAWHLLEVSLAARQLQLDLRAIDLESIGAFDEHPMR